MQEVDGAGGTTASPVTGASSPSTSNLQSSFQQLMQDLSGTAASSQAAAATGTPSLQSFLQTLLTNLNTQGAASSSAGLLVHATA